MAKPSRWTAEKRYQIVKESLREKEPVGQIARRHEASEGLHYQWRDKFYTKAAKPRWLYFKGHSGSSRKKAVGERRRENLQKLISEQVVEVSFLKRLSRN